MTTGIRAIGDEISQARALASTAIIAGGAGDNTLITGVIIDRTAHGMPQSGVLSVPFTTTLAAAQNLSLASWVLQHGDAANLSDAATFQASAAAVVLATSAGGGTVSGLFEVNVALMGARRYLRLNATPDLSAATVDTATLHGHIVFGGADRLPQ